MDREFGKSYAALYRSHWWWAARREFLLRELWRGSPGNAPLGLLDVGCGDGLFFEDLFAFGEVFGVERDDHLLNPEGPHRQLIHVGPFDASFQPGRQFDVILMLDVLEHIRDRAAALRRAHELLAPGGRMILTVPAFNLLWTQHDVLCDHQLRYTRKSLSRAVEAEGFAVTSSQYFFHWMFAAKLGVRLIQVILPAPPASPRMAPDWINRLLLHGCRLEQALFSKLRLPFGSSVFMECAASVPDRQ